MKYDTKETAAIRAAAFERSQGRCECCGEPLGARFELDHWLGRHTGQTLENTWVLTPACHYAKTRNSPSGIAWARRFQRHAEKHGYLHMAVAAANRVFWMESKGLRA